MLKNGVRLSDCGVDGSPGWVCEHCCTAEYWEYGDRGDPVAEALTMASAWMHRCGTWNPAPIVAAFDCKPAALRWDGRRLVLAERVADPAPADGAVTYESSAGVEAAARASDAVDPAAGKPLDLPVPPAREVPDAEQARDGEELALPTTEQEEDPWS